MKLSYNFEITVCSRMLLPITLNNYSQVELFINIQNLQYAQEGRTKLVQQNLSPA